MNSMMELKWEMDKKESHPTAYEDKVYFIHHFFSFSSFKSFIIRGRNKYSNCNEAVAAKNSAYSFKELFYDAIDFSWKYWVLVLFILIFILKGIL